MDLSIRTLFSVCMSCKSALLKMFQNIRISISNVEGGLSLPRVTSRKGISQETVTERDEGGWVVLKTQI